MAEQITEAADFLHHSDLLPIIAKDLTGLGYVGENRNKKLLYLGAVSRKLNSPLAFVLQAAPSSGKSELLNAVTALQESGEVYELTRLTRQALFYLGREDPNIISHKWVTIAESPGAREANYAIRTLITEKKLRLTTVQQGTAVVIELRGPIAYCETTTQGVLNGETASRMFNLRFDTSAAQTRQVQQSLAQQAMSNVSPTEREAIIRRHHASQKMLVHTEVLVPFATEIRFPFQHELSRREFKKFLDVIKASAFLHQYQRRMVERAGLTYIVAQPEDFEIAKELTMDLIVGNLCVLHPQARYLLDVIDKVAGQKPEKVFTRSELVAAQPELSLRQVRYWLDSLSEINYVETLSGSKGKEYFYRLVPGQREHTIELQGEELEHLSSTNESNAGEIGKEGLVEATTFAGGS
jgi:hypothetical protein